jgi:hypothetical protein
MVQPTAPEPIADVIGVTVDPTVQQMLTDVQAGFKMESVFCLQGGIVGDYLVIDNMTLAKIVNRTESTAKYHNCRETTFIGVAHNHPDTESYGGTCIFSKPDQSSFAMETRAVIDVVVGRDCIRGRLRDGREISLK